MTETTCVIKYSENYSLFIYFFNSTEVRTEALKIFCAMIPLLVDTWSDFASFRVVRPYMCHVEQRVKCELQYCRSGNIREVLIFADFARRTYSRIEASREILIIIA